MELYTETSVKNEVATREGQQHLHIHHPQSNLLYREQVDGSTVC